MKTYAHTKHALAVAVALGLAALLSSCKKEEPAPPVVAEAPAVAAPVAPPPTAEELARAAVENSKTLVANSTTWTPEQLEELAAPVALYPDPVLDQVLVAATNPQEVLDGGNWLLDNSGLKGKALDQAAEAAGFTPPMRALFPFPETVDMMAQEMGWTQELGQAYVNDQAGVLDAVQRLRRQAADVGNLKSSEQMTVSTQSEGGKEYVAISPPSPQVVYVPQYDPVAVYAPASTVSTVPQTVVVEDKGHSTASLVTTGLLAFGAGMLVNELFDDDDDDCYRNYYNYHCRNNNYYGGGYWGNPRPYYPRYPYNPRYGNGYYPSHNYNRPGNNVNNSFNNNNITINSNNKNSYWNNFDDHKAQPRANAHSPISAAKPGRNDLADLNRSAANGPKRKPTSNGPEFSSREQFKSAPRPANNKTGSAVQGTYKGAKPDARPASRPDVNRSSVPTSKPASRPSVPTSKPASRPSVPTSKPASRPSVPTSKPASRPSVPTSKPASRPSAPTSKPASRPSVPTSKPASRPSAPASKPADRSAAKPAARPSNNKPAVKPAARPAGKPADRKPRT